MSGLEHHQAFSRFWKKMEEWCTWEATGRWDDGGLHREYETDFVIISLPPDEEYLFALGLFKQTGFNPTMDEYEQSRCISFMNKQLREFHKEQKKKRNGICRVCATFFVRQKGESGEYCKLHLGAGLKGRPLCEICKATDRKMFSQKRDLKLLRSPMCNKCCANRIVSICITVCLCLKTFRVSLDLRRHFIKNYIVKMFFTRLINQTNGWDVMERDILIVENLKNIVEENEPKKPKARLLRLNQTALF